jgi:hypothetical protein
MTPAIFGEKPPSQILQIRAPLPGIGDKFRFEWHPARQRVYLIRLGVTPEVGDPIATEIETHGGAFAAVQIWCRGYRERERAEQLLSGERKADQS